MKEWQAFGSLVFGPLLIGMGFLAVLGYVDMDSSAVSIAVGLALICTGIGIFVLGFDFLFRPAEPGPREENRWNYGRIVAKTNLLIGAALIFAAVVMILVQGYSSK